MGCRGPWPLWRWVLWGFWVLPAGEVKGQLLVPTLDPSESGSISQVSDSSSAELSPGLPVCREPPAAAAAAARAALPSPAGPTAAPAGTQSSGILVPQAAAGGLVPAGSTGEQEGPPSPAALPGGPAMQGSPQAGSGAGVSSPGAAGHPTSLPPAPIATWHMQPLPFKPQPASISQETASPMKMAAATVSPPNTEGASMAAPPPADPPSESLAKVTFSSTTMGTSKATEAGTRALPKSDHSASQDPPGPPAQLPPALLPQLPYDAVLGTEETLPPSHSTALGTAGHGLPGDNAVTQPQATTRAVGTLATGMDVIAGEHIPPLGSTSAELVSIRNEASTKATAGTAIPETKDTPQGLSTSLFPHAALSDPDGPSPRPFPHSMGSLLPQSLSTGLGTTTAEAAAGASPSATPSMAMPLSLMGTSGAKPDKAPQAAAAAPPSITAFGIDVPPLLEGRANVGMALEVSPSSIPQEMTTVMSPVSLTALLQAMGASGDPQPDGSTTGRAMGMGFLEVSMEENPGASAAGPTPTHTTVTARPPPEPPATEDKPTAGITSLAVGHTSVRGATAASWTGATGTTAHVETPRSESSTEGAAPSASSSSTYGPDSKATGTSLATMLATTPSTSTFPSNANLPTTSTGWETFVTRATTAMPPATAGATSTSSAPSLAVTHSETSGGNNSANTATAATTGTTAGNTTATTGNSTANTANTATTGTTAGNTTATTSDKTRATTAGNSTAIAPTAPVSPAKEAGSLPAPGTTAPVRPRATTSPVTTLSHGFGTQRGPSTELSTSAHTIPGHRAPALEPQPTHELIKPATSLYPFGVEGGDQEYVRRMVDFNSPLFKPEIGFPFGKSLRDALYFTDNGQIIFPPTDNYVLSNPNPPPWGFTGRESLPMVAAFWDDADFSKGVGTTWYQEYSTLSSTRDPVVQDVEAKIEKYLKIPYVAKWTLKVTWENAPAYPSRRDDTQTSTYQAVLTTDGSRSFALLLYQDGGMRWDYTKLAAANVLIGFSSGNGYAQNNKLTQKPPAVKYRPDQYSSTGSDVRGLWIYRLDSRSRVNYRLQCLAWLDTEPAPATWNRQLPPCPCSRPQAELDPRYHWSRGPEDTSVRMLRTVSPSPAGAGVRCLYQGGSLLEGWQERTWSLPFHTATDRELEAFDWCCRRVGKPLFCARFAEKRPRVGCEGYVPPTPAGAFGDPHITTLDGLTYTFNGLGDFVLLLASDTQTSFVLHGRTAQTGMAQATNFVAFAAQYISNTTTTVEWTLGSQDDIQVLLNNETIQFSYSQDLGDKVYYSPGVLLVNSSSVTAVFDGTVAVSVAAASGILSVLCSLPDWYRSSTRGLLGVWDHDPADDFQMPNGTSIPVNSSEEEIYSYGMTWAVGEHSLFTQPLDSPAQNFTPFFLSRLRQEDESQYQLAASQCHGSRECIYDSLSTGNLALGLATQSLAADFQQRKTALNAFPPVITGDASITAFRTEKVRKQYHALGVGARFIPHLSPELNISENGTLIWEPRGIAPFTINLEAVGSNNISALLQLHFTLCRCSRSQECDYSNTVTLRESSLQLAACRCESGYSGPFCQNPPEPCSQGCFPGVGCDPSSGCGPCPPGLTGDGQHCSDVDECAQGTECPENSTCTNTVGSYICSCLASEQGERPGCGSACGYHSCPEGYCSNGGCCHLHPITCTPTCTCPPAFTDQRCQVAGGDFQPLPSTDLPRRSIQMKIKTLQNTTAEEVNSTVSAILDSLEVKAFQSNTNITQMTDGDGFTFVVVSEFAYDSRSSIIRFLNEELPAAVTGAFNGRRRRREAGTGLLFQRLHRDNITDLVKLTVDELRDYFPCSLNGYKGYQLHYVGSIGFVCISPCKMGYCQHGGQCQHLPEGPTCSCLPFSIYSPAGARCEWLAISLAAFLGILLGALALLCLLFAIACLALHLCRQHRRQHQGAKETLWRTRPFSSLTTAGEQAEPTLSHSLKRHWKLQLQAIDPSVQIRIQRPHVMPPNQSLQQP
ncbi:PREDICTED: mucin-4 [Ficedula albicollis]|uniref:mucin-4 n=1 Tax=Ficedula albicollis TaxID=59894 RepID=UPI0007AD7C26|nr:PREDICTED: mucin-4 [Ficedula albicollis]